MTRSLRLLLLLVVLAATTSTTDVAAQEADTAPAAIPGLAVVENEAEPDFPEGITFTLDAETEDPIAAVELLYRSPGVETYSVELPVVEAGVTTLDLEHLVDLRSGRLPPGVDVDYHWRIVEDDGDVVETPEQTLLWADDRYEWTALEGPNVTVYAYAGDGDFQQEILDAAERTVTNLTESYGAAPDQRIRVWAYANKDDMYGALAPNSEPWIAGAAYPGLHVIMAILPPGDYGEVARVVSHEISHQVLHQATENPFNAPPQWMDEGLATYWQESGRDRFYTFALERAAAGEIPPLRTLNGQFPYDRDGAMAGYAYSLSAVMFILDTWGDEGMSRLIDSFPEGVTYEDAVQQALGISFDELDQQWRADLIADAEAAGAAGATRIGDGGPEIPGFGTSLERAIGLASGTLILGVVVVVALVAFVVSRLRARHTNEEWDDELGGNVRWHDWPDGLEPPGRHAQTTAKP